jgi:hypothetical protein
MTIMTRPVLGISDEVGAEAGAKATGMLGAAEAPKLRPRARAAQAIFWERLFIVINSLVFWVY